MRHVEYPAKTEGRGGDHLQHTYYPWCPGDRQGHSQRFPGHVPGCWQMPSLCSTPLLKPIRNFFGSGFALAGKISLLTQQQQVFCEGSTALSLLSPQGQSYRSRSPPGTEESKPQSSTLPARRAGLLAQVPAAPSPAWLGLFLAPIRLPWDTDGPCS